MVNFRRIVHRGLINYSGELWYREGLPSDVFRRLVIRKENETPLDRFSGDYEELITYANFRDLADIIAGNEALRERLSILEPRDGTTLLERLLELDEMRRAIAPGKTTSEEDAERLSRYYEEFRQAIKGGRRAGSKDEGGPRSQGEADSSSRSRQLLAEEETLESIFGPEETPPPIKRSGRLVVKISANDLRNAGSSAPASVDTVASKAEASPPPADAAESVGSEAPITEAVERPKPRTPRPAGPIDQIETVEQAILDGDDEVVLKALHLEVTAVADGMLRRDPKTEHPVWVLVNRVSWLDEHLEVFDLEPLGVFYTLADEFLKAHSSHAKASDLKEMLADAGFSKLLLSLREMFLAGRAKATSAEQAADG